MPKDSPGTDTAESHRLELRAPPEPRRILIGRGCLLTIWVGTVVAVATANGHVLTTAPLLSLTVAAALVAPRWALRRCWLILDQGQLTVSDYVHVIRTEIAQIAAFELQRGGRVMRIRRVDGGVAGNLLATWLTSAHLAELEARSGVPVTRG